MAFRQNSPDHFPYNILRVYFDSNHKGQYCYDGNGPPPGTTLKDYMIAEGRALLNTIGRQWVKAEVLTVEGDEQGETTVYITFYP